LVDVLLIIACVLLAITTCASVEYYRHLRRVRMEYEKAKEVVEDVILSFNRELKREAEKLELVAYKVEAASSKSGKALEKVEEFEKKLQVFEPKITAVLEEEKKMLTRLDEIEKKTRDVVTSQEALTTKISSLEEQTKQFSMVPETKVEAVIPIKREKALAPLTETELSALEMLATEGPKTAPEIKDKIKLSREHTARLMKKLYEGGYLERDSSKIPFKYSVKKEMEKLLKKPKAETA
jgi:Fic family protein